MRCWLALSLLACARAPPPAETPWEALGKPWDWQACDPDLEFERQCKPVAPECTMTVVDESVTHGLGNMLLHVYVQKSLLAFEKGCSAVFKEQPGPNQKTPFKMSDHFQVAERVPTVLSPKCIAYAITQPKAKVRKLLETAKASSDPTLPLVAMAVRTGWLEDMSPAWPSLECSAYTFPGAAANVVQHEGFGFSSLLQSTAKAADSAFGRWNGMVTSDSYGAKAFGLETLGKRGQGVVDYFGALGHSNPSGRRVRATDAEEQIALARTAVVDLVLLSEASILVFFPSKFPKAAALRSMCPQRTNEFHRAAAAPLGGITGRSEAGQTYQRGTGRCLLTLDRRGAEGPSLAPRGGFRTLYRRRGSVFGPYIGAEGRSPTRIGHLEPQTWHKVRVSGPVKQTFLVPCAGGRRRATPRRSAAAP